MNIMGGLQAPFDDNVNGVTTGRFYVHEAGTFTWWVYVDDASTYKVDGVQIFSQSTWGHHTFKKHLSAGWHDFESTWWQGVGGYAWVIEYAGPGLGRQHMKVVNPPSDPICNWKCYDERYPDLASFAGDWELLKDHYVNIGKSGGRNCDCDMPEIELTLEVTKCGDETLSMTAAGTAASLSYYAHEVHPFFKVHQANSGCGNSAGLSLQNLNLQTVYDCALACHQKPQCESFFVKTNANHDCRLYKAGCTINNDNSRNYYKLTGTAPVVSAIEVTNAYDTWFSISTTRAYCGIKRYWLGGCDAGGYENTKYTDPSKYPAMMNQQNKVIAKGSGNSWYEFVNSNIA